MSEAKITGAEISEWLRTQKQKAVWLAKTLGVTPATVSRWINGKVVPTGSDEAMLLLLIRGKMPFEIVHSRVLHGLLDFTEDQWRVITVIAGRQGITPGKWIADKVRWIMAGDDECRRELKIAETERGEIPRFQLVDLPARGADETA